MSRSAVLAATFCLFAALSLLMLHSTVKATAQSGLTLRIVTPTSGAVLFTNQAVQIQAQIDPLSLRGSLPPLKAEVTVDGPSGASTVAAGDLRLLAGTDLVGTIWNPASLAPGEYRITVTANLADSVVKASEPVQVRLAPKVNVQTRRLGVTAGRVNVQFSVRSVYPTGELLRFGWLFGDGTPRQTTYATQISHGYRFPGSYIVYLVYEDRFAGRGFAIFRARLTSHGAV
jgi:hypothetical protein